MADAIYNSLPIGLTPGGVGMGKTGPGNMGIPGPVPGTVPGSGNVAAFKDPVVPAGQQQTGPSPYGYAPNSDPTDPRVLKFIPPLALYNDASQWVNLLMFNRPMAFNQNPDSNPPLRAQYFTPPPIQTSSLPAGAMNLQLQLGQIAIQVEALTTEASNFFGG